MLFLDTVTAVDFPFAKNPETGDPLAGLTTSVTHGPVGLNVLTYQEAASESDTGPGVMATVASHVWSGTGFEDRVLSDGPPFSSRLTGLFAAAAVYDSKGVLWVGSSAGEVAALDGEEWTMHFDECNSQLSRPVLAMAVDTEDNVYVGTTDGVRVLTRNAGWTGTGVVTIEATTDSVSPRTVSVAPQEEMAIRLRNSSGRTVSLVFEVAAGLEVRTHSARPRSSPEDWGGVAYAMFDAPAMPGRDRYYVDAGTGEEPDPRTSGYLLVVAPDQTVALPSTSK